MNIFLLKSILSRLLLITACKVKSFVGGFFIIRKKHYTTIANEHFPSGVNFFIPTIDGCLGD
jgi:hypothetical protein